MWSGFILRYQSGNLGINRVTKSFKQRVITLSVRFAEQKKSTLKQTLLHITSMYKCTNCLHSIGGEGYQQYQYLKLLKLNSLFRNGSQFTRKGFASDRLHILLSHMNSFERKKGLEVRQIDAAPMRIRCPCK